MITGKKSTKKPTIKEVAGVTIELGQRVTSLMHFVSELEKAFSVYVEMKGDIENFKNYIDEQYKKRSIHRKLVGKSFRHVNPYKERSFDKIFEPPTYSLLNRA